MLVACLNNISQIGLDKLSKTYQVTTSVEDASLLLVRSFNMLEMDVNQNVLAIARAGAGVNNIPLEKMAKQGIVVFNTPGANSNGVKELVIAGLLLASRDIISGVNWVKAHNDDELILKSIEKAKQAFGGTEILGKTIGVIGLGAVGGKVAQACFDLGMNVIGYDPFLSEEARVLLPQEINIVSTLDEVYFNSDFISLHLPLLDSTKHMINKNVFAKMKKGLTILNFSRDQLVDDDQLKTAMEQGIIHKYVTDFPNYKTSNMENVICIPHLGASTVESEDNCAVMAVLELRKFIEEGNIEHSVNFPNLDAGVKTSKGRVLLLHQAKELINEFMSVLSKTSSSNEVINLVIKTKGNYGATLIDLSQEISEETLNAFMGIEGVIKVRII
ncbi:MAG: 3-phosphoglycerate dehydrogenase [Firmicutes bacterium]|nr:3-phosphoglycerate dehydrogenase [Bacillota bacterium]